MKIVEIPGERIGTEQELHDFLKSELDFPSYYGGNLDALWDTLVAYSSKPLTISWRNYQESEKELGKRAEKFKNLFEDVEKEMKEFSFVLN
jgi:ribonuclease inhibitor